MSKSKDGIWRGGKGIRCRHQLEAIREDRQHITRAFIGCMAVKMESKEIYNPHRKNIAGEK